jgi:uncharacterized protein (TIGR02270 family)
MTSGPRSRPIGAVVLQHVEEAAHLRHVRSALVRAPHVRLIHLGRLDERLAAHLDGVGVAGEYGVGLAHRALERPGRGEIFVATVRALEDRDAPRLERLLAIAEALPASRAGMLSAFGWVSGADLSGTASSLLESDVPWRREVGLAACAMHGVDSGAALVAALRDQDAGLRVRAARVASQVGRVDVLGACLGQLADAEPGCAFEAARSAVLLGDRGAALAALEAVSESSSPMAVSAALERVLPIVAPQRARALLARVVHRLGPSRVVIRGIAAAGDPHYVPWLLQQVNDPEHARVAGEAFTTITGVDLAYLDLDADAPSAVAMPDDDPDHGDVAMDEDDGLPWPDQDKIAAWWKANGSRFTPGTRYFMGQPPSTAHCFSVLQTGFQRQRRHAAEYLCLLKPGTPLFNIAAPARRQKRLLTQMAGT